MKKVVLAALLLLSTSVFAGSPPADVPEPLKVPLASGMKVDKKFPAVSGLTGWLLSKNGTDQTIVFTTADGKTLIAGMLIDGGGNNLTAAYGEKYVPKPDFNGLWLDMAKSAYVSEGVGDKSMVYVFADPNCVYCHLMWKAVQPYLDKGLQVRWVLTGLLQEDSAGKAAAILTAKDPLVVWTSLQKAYKASSNLKPVAVDKDIQAKLDTNAQLMGRFGVQGTPAIVWKDRNGTVRVKAGMPRLGEIAGIAGVPEIPTDDADLRNFK